MSCFSKKSTVVKESTRVVEISPMKPVLHNMPSSEERENIGDVGVPAFRKVDPNNLDGNLKMREGEKLAVDDFEGGNEGYGGNAVPVSRPTATTFMASLNSNFSEAVSQNRFVEGVCRALSRYGFVKGSCVPCTCVCREAITQPFVDLVAANLGRPINLSSLAGLVCCGKSSFATVRTPPRKTSDDRERYVYFALPHIAIGADGRVGHLQRPEFRGAVQSCSALTGLLSGLARQSALAPLDMEDVEQNLLRNHVSRRLPVGTSPDLVLLTKTLMAGSAADLERMLDMTLDKSQCSYAVITGVIVHGPDGDYVWPGKMYMVDGTAYSDLSSIFLRS